MVLLWLMVDCAAYGKVMAFVEKWRQMVKDSLQRKRRGFWAPPDIPTLKMYHNMKAIQVPMTNFTLCYIFYLMFIRKTRHTVLKCNFLIFLKVESTSSLLISSEITKILLKFLSIKP